MVCSLLLEVFDGNLNADVSELCYLLRYPARHGRQSACPFSIRQTVVYQRFDYHERSSKWILVQAPGDLAGDIRSSLSSEGLSLAPSEIHLRVFSIAERDWRDYICYLEDELRKLV